MVLIGQDCQVDRLKQLTKADQLAASSNNKY